MFSAMRAPIATSTSRQWCLITPAIGVLSSSGGACWKTGDSLMESLIHRPTITSTPDSRNGTRQPHDRNASSDWKAASSASTPVASRLPPGAPALRPRGPEAAPARVAVLGDDEHRAAPLAAQREALHQAERGQQQRSRAADGRVRGQAADEEGRHAHHEQADDQQRLAAEAVAEVAEDQAAERAGHEADGVGEEREERAGQRVGVGEEQDVEDERRRRAVQEEVVPLDGGADQARGHDLFDTHSFAFSGGFRPR
ncbi:hypothetical protein GCM10020219_093330 [Nonomuraea dietziae]